MIGQLLDELRHTSWLEAVAVLSGIAYVLLIMRRQRLGWPIGALSSIIYVYLSALSHLPMQSVLQAYYVVMAAYGWFSWTRNAREESGRVYRWSWRRHLLAVAVIVLISVASARWLAQETHAAWPLLDSLTTWTSFFATWLVARSVVDNWLYWIAADAVMVFLFGSRGLIATSLLFSTYLIVAVFGYFSWLRTYRAANP
jgi:nicotinamide mononucleotide transporter